MPWELRHNHPACRADEWAVVNMEAERAGRHSIEGCHPTRERALAQQRALYAKEPQAQRHEVETMEPNRLVALIEQKAVTDDGPGEITGLASVYGNVDLQDDIMEHGALHKTVSDWRGAKAKPPLLDWHGNSISRLIGSVVELKTTAAGLWFRAQFSSSPEAQAARQKAKEGHLSGVSIGYLPVRSQVKMIGDRMIRVLSEVRLLEISLTPIPANPQAQLASVKSISEDKAVSDKPWSGFTQADYTDEQWARACLIDTGQGEGKQRYSLPVREPSGTLNRNGVHAAAARLNQVQVAADKKAAAARALVRLYGQLDEEPPDSLRRMAGQSSSSLDYDTFDEALRAAMSIPFGPARKAAVDQLVTAYDPTVHHDADLQEQVSKAAGQVDEPPPTAPAAATTGAEPAGSTAETERLALRARIDDATAYALRVINLEPRDGALVGTPPLARAGALAPLEVAKAMSDLDQLEAELGHAEEAT